jgi:hypothetical protein
MKPVLWAVLLAAPLAAQVHIAQHGIEYVSVEIKGKPFTQFFIGPETNKPYLHPLRSASGKIVTRGYPMEEIPGESHDHPHHRGLWFSHGDVNGFDFWGNETRGAKFGRIVLAKSTTCRTARTRAPSTPPSTGAIPRQGAADRSAPDDFLQPAEDPHHRLRHHPDGPRKVVFGDTKEGTFAVRVASALEEAPAQPAAHRPYGGLPGPRGRKADLGQTRRLGGLLWRGGRRAAGHRDVRPSVESSTSDMVARACLRPVRGQYLRPARFRER